MRISTIQQFNSGVRGISDNYSSVTRTQEQISSGKRLLTPADDPVATVRLLQLNQESNRLEQYSTNMTAANNSLTQEESILNSVNNALQRVREIAIRPFSNRGTRAARRARSPGQNQLRLRLTRSCGQRWAVLCGGPV